jgi:hypothetical protein
MREFYKPIGFSDSVFWFFALIGIVARRVFWFALMFAGAPINLLMAWQPTKRAHRGPRGRN